MEASGNCLKMLTDSIFKSLRDVNESQMVYVILYHERSNRVKSGKHSCTHTKQFHVRMKHTNSRVHSIYVCVYMYMNSAFSSALFRTDQPMCFI